MKIKRFAALLLAGVLCASALTGCALNKNETIATLGEEKITLGVANFMCRYQQAQMEDALTQYVGEDPWSQDLYGSGSNMQETTKSQVMETLQEMYTLQLHMDDYDVTISDDEKKEISDTASSFMENNSEDTLKEMGATQDIVEELLTLYTVKNKMYNAIVADVDTNITDEEANMRAYSMVKIAIDGSYDSSYNFTAYTEDQVTELKVNAKKMVDAVAQPSDLETAAEANGFTVTNGTYDADDSALDETVKTTLDGLKEGEVSGLITTDKALYMVRLDKENDEEATEKNRTTILQTRKDTLYNDTLSDWEKDTEWKVKDKVLAKIEFKNHLTQTTESSEEETTTQSDVTETIDGTERAN